MKVKFILEDLCCANCAAKIEEKVSKIEGVESASVNFLTTKMILNIDEARENEILAEVEKTVKKVEPDTVMKRM